MTDVALDETEKVGQSLHLGEDKEEEVNIAENNDNSDKKEKDDGNEFEEEEEERVKKDNNEKDKNAEEEETYGGINLDNKWKILSDFRNLRKKSRGTSRDYLNQKIWQDLVGSNPKTISSWSSQDVSNSTAGLRQRRNRKLTNSQNEWNKETHQEALTRNDKHRSTTRETDAEAAAQTKDSDVAQHMTNKQAGQSLRLGEDKEDEVNIAENNVNSDKEEDDGNVLEEEERVKKDNNEEGNSEEKNGNGVEKYKNEEDEENDENEVEKDENGEEEMDRNETKEEDVLETVGGDADTNSSEQSNTDGQQYHVSITINQGPALPRIISGSGHAPPMGAMGVSGGVRERMVWNMIWSILISIISHIVLFVLTEKFGEDMCGHHKEEILKKWLKWALLNLLAPVALLFLLLWVQQNLIQREEIPDQQRVKRNATVNLLMHSLSKIFFLAIKESPAPTIFVRHLLAHAISVLVDTLAAVILCWNQGSYELEHAA